MHSRMEANHTRLQLLQSQMLTRKDKKNWVCLAKHPTTNSIGSSSVPSPSGHHPISSCTLEWNTMLQRWHFKDSVLSEHRSNASGEWQESIGSSLLRLIKSFLKEESKPHQLLMVVSLHHQSLQMTKKKITWYKWWIFLPHHQNSFSKLQEMDGLVLISSPRSRESKVP